MRLALSAPVFGAVAIAAHSATFESDLGGASGFGSEQAAIVPAKRTRGISRIGKKYMIGP
jgi:hypothetical protein